MRFTGNKKNSFIFFLKLLCKFTNCFLNCQFFCIWDPITLYVIKKPIEVVDICDENSPMPIDLDSATEDEEEKEEEQADNEDEDEDDSSVKKNIFFSK